MISCKVFNPWESDYRWFNFYRRAVQDKDRQRDRCHHLTISKYVYGKIHTHLILNNTLFLLLPIKFTICVVLISNTYLFKKKNHIHISLVLSRSIYLFFIIRYVHNLVYAWEYIQENYLILSSQQWISLWILWEEWILPTYETRPIPEGHFSNQIYCSAPDGITN